MKYFFKDLLYLFFLVNLLFQAGCQSTKHTSTQLESSNSAFWKLRYNTIYNVDKVLKQAEEGMLRYEIIWYPHSLFGEPDLKYHDDLAAAILKIQDVLPQTAESDFKNSLYFRLGKAYYFNADYYTAFEYLELADTNNSDPDILLWKSKVLTRIGKALNVMLLLEKIKLDSLPKKVHPIYYAVKSELFFRINNSDSALFYLDKALESNPPKQYKPFWQLKIGKQFSVTNPDKAVVYLRKVAQSNTVSSVLKLQAEIELIGLNQQDVLQKANHIHNLEKRGYSIGNEWQLHFALANLFNNNFNSDTARLYFDKMLNHENIPVILKNKSNWELSKLFVYEKKYDLAEKHIASIDLNHLYLFDNNDRSLIANAAEWLRLLQKIDDTISTSSSMYELARFYANLGLQDEALALIKKINIEDSNFDYVHFSVLLDTSEIELINAKYSELILQRQQFHKIYSNLYRLYQQDSFQNVISGVDKVINDVSLYPKDQTKLAYLKAFAVGNSFALDSLLKSFAEIETKYNQDIAIVRKVKMHIDFIEKNKSLFNNRKIALEKHKWSSVGLREIVSNEKNPHYTTETTAPKNGTFIDYQLPELEPYYFVVLINDTKINLSSTRYGIGQFIRTRFPRQGYGHELSDLNNSHQLIKVGIFENLQIAKEFENKIVNLLPQIIKIDEEKYSTFVIPKSILDMSKELSSINDYLKKYIEN